MKMAELVNSETEPENKSQLDLKCDLCQFDGGTKDGVSVCVDCMECLCKTCSEIHSTNEALKGHKTVTKDNLPVNFTSQTLNELKDMVICGTHEMRFEYFCEDHTDFICQFCTRKAHRVCNRITKIQNVQSSPESVLNEIREIRKWFTDVIEQRKELKELESAERKKQFKLKTTILAKNQALLDQSFVGDENGELGEDTEVVDSIRDAVKRVDKNEDLLRAVLFLNDTESAMVVSRRVKQSLENYSLKTNIESRIDSKVQMKKISDRMKIFEAVQELVSASYCDVEGEYLNDMKHLVRRKTCMDAEVQTDMYQDTDEEQLPMVCVTESSDVHTKQRAALGEARTYKNVNVQTEDASDTSTTVRLVPCTTEDLTASADVDTEPDYDVSGQQSDSYNVVHGSKDPYRVDCGCQTTDNTQERDAKIPLSERNLWPIGTYNACRCREESKCNISGICVLRSGRIVLIDSNNKCLKVYDELFHFKMLFRLKWTPIGICDAYHDFDRVAITFDSRRVETFEISEKEICFVRGFDLSLYCRGICSVSSDTIAVLVSDVDSLDDSFWFLFTSSDDNDIRIQIRDISNGRIIGSIDTFENDICNPGYIIQDKQNNIIIGEENQVSAFDRDGDRLWYYKGYKKNKLEVVLGMDMDTEGNIYVCSYGSNSIHQVSSFNYKNNRVIIPYVPAPMSVAYDPHLERLFVGSGNSCVYVYRFV